MHAMGSRKERKMNIWWVCKFNRDTKYFTSQFYRHIFPHIWGMVYASLIRLEAMMSKKQKMIKLLLVSRKNHSTHCKYMFDLSD